MKITSDYTKQKLAAERLKNGDVVFMKATRGACDFYGMFVYGIGIIELENGSDAYCRAKGYLYIGDAISHWTIEKVFKNCELIIRE